MLRSLLAFLAFLLVLQSAVASGGDTDSSAVSQPRPQEAELAFLSGDVVAPMPPAAAFDLTAAPLYAPLRPISDFLAELTGSIAPQVGRATAAPVVRGTGPRRMTVLFDGVPLGHSALRAGPSFLPLGMVDPAALGSVRLRLGPGPQDLFAGPASSVVQLVPRLDDPEAGGPAVITTAQQYSSADRGWSGRLTATGTTGRLRFQLGGLGRVLNDLRTGNSEAAEAVQPYTGLRESAFHAVGAYRINDRLELRGGVLSSNRARQASTRELETPGAGATATSFAIFDPRQMSLAYASARLAGEAAIESAQLTAWLNRLRETRTVRKANWIRTVFDDDRMTAAGLRADAVVRIAPAHRVRVGADFTTEWVDARRKEVRDNGDVFYQRGRFPGDVMSHTGGVFLEESWKPSRRFSLEYGARLSVRAVHVGYGPSVFGSSGALRDVNKTFGGISWHLRATHEVFDGWQFFSSVGSGFRPPDLDELAANADWQQGRDIPNPNVQAENALEFEVGITNASSAGRRLSATVYHTRYRDPIYRSWAHAGPDGLEATSDDLFGFMNFEAVRILGTEIEASAPLFRDVSQSLMLTANAIVQRVSAPIGAPRFAPPAVMRVALHYSRSHLTLESFVRSAAGTRPVAYADGAGVINGTDAWTTFNTRGTYRVGTRLQLYVALENIFDAGYREHGSYLLAPGRNVITGASYRF